MDVCVLNEPEISFSKFLIFNIVLLMIDYDIMLPIVDTSRYNQILVSGNENIKIKYLKK